MFHVLKLFLIIRKVVLLLILYMLLIVVRLKVWDLGLILCRLLGMMGMLLGCRRYLIYWILSNKSHNSNTKNPYKISSKPLKTSKPTKKVSKIYQHY